MDIVLKSAQSPDLAAAGHEIVRLFYPDAKLHGHKTTGADPVLTVSSFVEGDRIFGEAELSSGQERIHETVAGSTLAAAGDERNHSKRLVKQALFRVLTRFTGMPPSPWGILTGIRPTKIVHRLMDAGYSGSAIVENLRADYDLALEKARLLTDIALSQRPFFLPPEEAAKSVSVYIGIPFCPTRCAYCSFPAYPVGAAGGLVNPFLEALQNEIKSTGWVLGKLGKKVQTVYIGGGTPTVLNTSQLTGLLDTIQECLISPSTRELTLEAGRPDTLTEDKLRAARDFGVTRLSINPQSMNQQTLETIGRCHSPEMIKSAVNMARNLGFNNLNMDIIIGLPGEAPEHVRRTLNEIEKLRPENLTVHTLAVKRASRLKEARDRFETAAPDQVTAMLELAAVSAENMGMHPYYLYRQKRMVSPQENIGFARPGFECIYNIQIIEERQTLIGMGCGAGSKFVEPGTWYLTSLYNPKDPETYISKIQEIVSRKVDKLGSFG